MRSIFSFYDKVSPLISASLSSFLLMLLISLILYGVIIGSYSDADTILEWLGRAAIDSIVKLLGFMSTRFTIFLFSGSHLCLIYSSSRFWWVLSASWLRSRLAFLLLESSLGLLIWCSSPNAACKSSSLSSPSLFSPLMRRLPLGPPDPIMPLLLVFREFVLLPKARPSYPSPLRFLSINWRLKSYIS